MTNGLSLAKSLGAKVTVIIVEESNWLAVSSLAEHWALEELDKYTEQIDETGKRKEQDIMAV